MQKHSQYRYALRKLSVGLTSVAVGLAFMAATTTTVHADSERLKIRPQKIKMKLLL